jgi:hypothetical protein
MIVQSIMSEISRVKLVCPVIAQQTNHIHGNLVKLRPFIRKQVSNAVPLGQIQNSCLRGKAIASGLIVTMSMDFLRVVVRVDLVLVPQIRILDFFRRMMDVRQLLQMLIKNHRRMESPQKDGML